MDAALLMEAREWIADCFSDVDDLSDREVLTGIERHYCGGIAQFIRDGG